MKCAECQCDPLDCRNLDCSKCTKKYVVALTAHHEGTEPVDQLDDDDVRPSKWFNQATQ